MADLIPDEGRAVTSAVALPREDEWYPNECQFCTREAALACQDSVCRAAHLGEDGDFPGNGRNVPGAPRSTTEGDTHG